MALTDAGKGMGLYDPGDDSVNRIDGTRASRSAAGALAHFAANLSRCRPPAPSMPRSRTGWRSSMCIRS